MQRIRKAIFPYLLIQYNDKTYDKMIKNIPTEPESKLDYATKKFSIKCYTTSVGMQTISR